MTRNRRDRSRGQGLVEFALIFPVLVLVLFGVFDFGRAIFAYNTLANAARAGVRVAIVNQNGPSLGCAGGSGGTPPDTTKVSAQDCALQAAVSLGGTTVTVSYMDITDTTACTVTGGTLDGRPALVGCLAVVTTTYTFHPITPIISNVVGNSIVLASTSKEPVEFVCPINLTLKCVPGT
jgi:Flp pilus assembly protein TadG